MDFMEYDLTLILLLVCISVFGYLAFRSRNVRTFQFQISIFILIWISGELANVLLENGIVSVPPFLNEIGYEIHVASMAFFGIFLYARYFYSSRRGKELIEDIEDSRKSRYEEEGSSEKKS
jgi:hypothetical protein